MCLFPAHFPYIILCYSETNRVGHVCIIRGTLKSPPPRSYRGHVREKDQVARLPTPLMSSTDMAVTIPSVANDA